MIVQFHFNLEPCSRPVRNLLSEKILCKSAGCLNREFSTEDHRVEQSINSLNFVFNMRRNWGGSQGRGRHRWHSHGTSISPTSCQNYVPKKDITYPSGIRLLLNHSLMAQMVKYLPTMQETQVRSLGWEDTLEKEMTTTPVFLPGEFLGQTSLEGYSPWGCKELDTTEHLSHIHTHTHTHTHARARARTD